jgi:Holliday junction resolvase
MARIRSYKKGARAEYKLKSELERAGWTVVRSAGSHGYWDLVAFRFRRGHVDILLIQVKAQSPLSRPKVIIQTGTFRAMEAIVFVFAGRRLLSQELPFEVKNPFESLGQLASAKKVASCLRKLKQPKRGRHDDRSE